MKAGKIAFVAALAALLLLMASAAYSAEERFYELTIVYNNGKLLVEDLAVKPGTLGEQVLSGSYRAEVVSFNGKSLYSKKFEIVGTLGTEEFDEETGTFRTIETRIAEPRVTLHLPYFTEGKRIDIYGKNSQKVLEIPVEQFANTCGNSICEPQESYESCPSDCLSGSADDYCDRAADKICDPDCAEERDVDCLVEGARLFKGVPKGGVSNNLQLFLTLIGIIGIIVTIVMIFAKIRAKEEEL